MGRATRIRIGQGIDIHPFKVGRPLYLGGVKIPSDVGLDGHSDADVLLHALIDSLLGAAGLPDIGNIFPDTNMLYKDASSMDLLKYVFLKVRKLGFSIVNCDITVLAEKPKIAKYVIEMKENIASILNISVDDVGIKATTSEGLGFIGRKEGIWASSVVLLEKDQEN